MRLAAQRSGAPQCTHTRNSSSSGFTAPSSRCALRVPRSRPTPEVGQQVGEEAAAEKDTAEEDLLLASTANLHLGKRPADVDTLLSAPSTAPQKAAILSALAAFDSDDDERDDTYDAADVGGTVDAAGGADDTPLTEGTEAALFRAW